MKKYILTIEFRYTDKSLMSEFSSGYVNKKITIGIFDNLEEAQNAGNESLKTLAEYFKVDNQFKNNYLFGSPLDLVTNVCTSEKVHYFAKIDTLFFNDLDATIKEALSASKRPQTYNID